jgi:homocysteine S-methyltransferase
MTDRATGVRGGGLDLAAALAAGPVVLDGGLATELERSGHDLSGALWSARLLREDPQAVVDTHLAYFAAGAQIATTASYQVSRQGCLAAGFGPEEWAWMLQCSVDVARQAQAQAQAVAVDAARARPTWVAASVGPYGAVLADGSEYHGDYGLTVAELRAFHRPRLAILAEAGADVLACETLPCLAEVEALCLELSDLELPAWVSLTVAGTRTRHGEALDEAYAMAGSIPTVLAVGLNCADPGPARDVVQLAAEASGKPVVVYPNSGETWDAGARTWAGGAGFAAAAVTSWITAGARLVGGCCRVGPAAIAEIATALRDAR